MIVATLSIQVHQGSVTPYINQFKTAEKILQRQPGYEKHTLLQKHRYSNVFLLKIYWDSHENLEAFRNSPDYQSWAGILNPYYTSTPKEDYSQVA